MICHFNSLLLIGITFESGNYVPSDDVFGVLISFQMADALYAVNGSQHTLSFKLTMGSSVVVYNVTIVPIRTLLEQPDLVVSSSVNTSLLASS